jgi:hypothetical protein
MKEGIPMAKYTEAELEIVAFDAEDVITTSEQEVDEDGNVVV